MHPWLFSVLLLCSTLCASAQGLSLKNPFFVAGVLGSSSGGGASDPCSSCTNETFNPAGYSISGWTETPNTGGPINEDYATAPAPIEGAQSLLVRNASGDSSFIQITVPDSAESWQRFSFIMTNTIVNGIRLSAFLSGGFVFQAELRTTGGKMQVVAGTATATLADSLVANTKYFVRFHYKQVAGVNNDVADVECNTTGTFDGAGTDFASLTTGSANATASIMGLGVWDWNFAGAFSGVIFDQYSYTNLGQPGNF